MKLIKLQSFTILNKTQQIYNLLEPFTQTYLSAFVVSLKSDHAVSLTLSRHCPLLTIRSYPQQDSALVRMPGQRGAGGGSTQHTVLNSTIGQGSFKPPFCWLKILDSL